MKYELLGALFLSASYVCAMDTAQEIDKIGEDVTPVLTPHNSPKLMLMTSQEGCITRTASLTSLSSGSSASSSGSSPSSDSSGESSSGDEMHDLKADNRSGSGVTRSIFSSKKTDNSDLKEMVRQQAEVTSELSAVTRQLSANVDALIKTTGNMPKSASDFMPKSLLMRHTDLEKRVYILEAKNALMTAVMVLMFLKMLGDTYVSLMSDPCECPHRD